MNQVILSEVFFMSRKTSTQPKIAAAKSESGQFAKHTATGCIISTLLTAVLFAAESFVALQLDPPHDIYGTLATAGAVISQLMGCFAAAKKRGKNGLLLGVAAAAAVALVYAAVGIFMGGEFPQQAAAKMAALLCAGGIGGILGVNTGRKTPKAVKAV
ncbi:MAG: TIGR04086 family membrane protein [Oscillospiraceae bacterium]|nr:TIGR04086 family membrane protein [Oscillospiraceae bacterium]